MSHIEFVDDILVYNSVSAVSGLFADTLEIRTGISSPDLDQVKAASANWDSTYLTVSALSAAWNIDYDGSDIKALTANWESTYIVTSGLSADWTTAFNTVCAWGSSSVPDIALKFTADILGNGIDNTYTYFHGLGTKDLVVSVIEIATGNIALAAIYVTDTQITVEFASPVSGTLYRLVAIGATNLTDYASISANWQSTFTTVSSNSSNWDSTYTTFRDQSGNFLTSETDSQTLSFNDSNKELSISNGNNISLSSLDVTSLTANWETTYSLVSSNSSNWETTHTNVRDNSANWESTYTTFRDQSGNFLTSETDSQTLTFDETTKEISITNGNVISLSSLDVTSLTANWETTYSLVSSNSSNWDSTYTTFRDQSGNFLTSETDSQILTFNEVTKELSISNGNNISLSSLDVTSLTANWETTYSLVSSNSSNWETTYTTFRDQSGNFLTSETDSQTLSFNESIKELSISNGNVISLSSLDVTGLSASWQNTYNTVNSNSATNWSYQGNDLKALSGNWQSTYTGFRDTSGSFLSISGGTLLGKLIAAASDSESKLNIGSRLSVSAPGTVSAGDLWISNQGVLTYRDTTVSRSIAATSLSNTFNQPQTIGSTSITPVLNVSNSGTGQAATFTANSLSAAVRITQTGGGNSILIEDDTNPDATPFIIDNLGSVGVGLSSMVGISSKLAVVGSISSTSVIFASEGNSDIWNSTYTNVNNNSAAWNANPRIFEATVRNVDTVPMVRGNVVYSFGATGDTMSVKLASNTSDTTSSKTLGFVNDNIAVGGTGTVTVMGRMEILNFGAPFVDGDPLWLGSTPGTYTRVKPIAPNHGVYLGVVERSNSGNGIAYVKVQNGYELEEIHDVLVVTPLSGQILRRNSANTLWINTDDASKWDNTYTTVNSNSATNWNNETIKSYTHSNFLPISGGTITQNLTVTGSISSNNNLYANNVSLNALTLTSDISTNVTSVTATDTYLKVILNNQPKYIRLFDIE